MAALDFPNSPTVGQQFAAPNGALYSWDGAVWTALPGGWSVFIGPSPPPNPPTGEMWWRSDPDQNLYIYFDDGNSKQWVSAVPTPSGMQRASVYRSGAGSLSIPNAAWTTLSFDTVVDNSSGFYSTGAQDRLTLAAGTYLIGASMGWGAGSAGTVHALRLNVTGAQLRESDVKPLDYAGQEVTGMFVVAANATAQASVYQDSGAALTGNNNNVPFLWAVKVG